MDQVGILVLLLVGAIQITRPQKQLKMMHFQLKKYVHHPIASLGAAPMWRINVNTEMYGNFAVKMVMRDPHTLLTVSVRLILKDIKYYFKMGIFENSLVFVGHQPYVPFSHRS